MDIPHKLIKNQRRIGLTGGIASGKSTITNYINKNKKIEILDADNLSSELVEPNTTGYKKILEYFGRKIIDESSEEKKINKTLLKNIIFQDKKHRKWIEKLLHPLIKEKMIEKCNQYKANKTILLVIPLLFEAKFEDICTEIWLVKCPKEIQISRLVKRDKITAKKASQIINIQLNTEKKVEYSDVILDNSNDQKKWINKIKELI